MEGNLSELTAVPAPPAVASAAFSSTARWRRWFWGPVKFALGAVLTQSLLGSLLVVGWTQRLMQREALKSWWRKRLAREGTFAEFAAAEPWLQDHRHAPNWVIAQNFREAHAAEQDGRLAGRLGCLARALTRSAMTNARAGLAALVNIWVLTLPGCALWLLGWWGGWQNSFHKGYEQSWVGPVVSWLGIFLFIAAMFYLPLASARQAVTGNWRAFYQGRTVWTLVRRSWLGCLGLALLFAALNGPAMILKSWPYYLPLARAEQAAQGDAGIATPEASAGAPRIDWNNLTEAQALKVLNSHYFWSGFYLFAAFVVWRVATARVYASAVLRAVQRGALGEEELGENEWRALHTLGLLQAHPNPERHLLVRVVAWAGSKAGRMVCALALFWVWFAVVAEIYISEFFAYHPVIGWLNQPLLQLPWFRYVPVHLQSPAGELLAALLAIGGGWLILRVTRALHRPVQSASSH